MPNVITAPPTQTYTPVKETVKKRLSVWHVMGAYVGGLLLLIIMNHYLLHFCHVPDPVTSALHALHFPVPTATL